MFNRARSIKTSQNCSKAYYEIRVYYGHWLLYEKHCARTTEKFEDKQRERDKKQVEM
jgi:hypothetical protein